MTRAFLATTSPGVSRAEDHGELGWQLSSCLEAIDVRCLATDTDDPHRIVAGTHGHGVLLSSEMSGNSS